MHGASFDKSFLNLSCGKVIFIAPQKCKLDLYVLLLSYSSLLICAHGRIKSKQRTFCKTTVQLEAAMDIVKKHGLIRQTTMGNCEKHGPNIAKNKTMMDTFGKTRSY